MKTNFKYIITLLTGAILTLSANAQQDAVISRYMFNGMLINPAFTGSHSYATAGTIFRKQWVGFKGAPVTTILYGDMPFEKKNCGAGINIAYDRIGETEVTDVNLNYAYHLQVNKVSKLAFGLKANLGVYKACLTNLTVWDANDPEFSANQSKVLPNFGVGAYYYGEKYYAGISLPQLLNYDSETFFSATTTTALETVRHYYLTGGYVFNIDEKFDIKPSALIRYTYMAPLQADINVQLYFRKIVSFGASYRTGDAAIFMAELLSVPNWRFGYAFDLSVSKIRKYNSGSHEVMIAYDFYKKDKKEFRFF